MGDKSSSYKKAGDSTTTPTDDKKRKEIEVKVPDVIIGIHSNTSANGDLTDGHAWISVTRDGTTTTYGLWPNEHPRVLDHNAATHIRKGMEPPSDLSNRYHKLTLKQQEKLAKLLKATVTWHYTYTCASWASDTYSAVTGEKVSASEYMLTGTPRQVTASIEALEAKDPTSIGKPKEAVDQKASSSMN